MSGLPGYKEIVDLIKKGATFEAQEKIMELRGACITLEDENHTLKKRIKELEDSLRFKEVLVFKAPFYFAPNDTQPYCSRCWEKDSIAIHPGPAIWSVKRAHYARECPQCRTEFKTRDGGSAAMLI
jgi:hypothetical protein